ncbi:ribosome biogenesis GTP-binding protein YihA/YsxC [Culicoidibacter larvae]|uniref:Probable GTP-binding protein EngB n=1 Tax=Culicoidibacter larvae TaxID=2579976 RepID=A0A5R8QFV4_9FIRM|nr:ribosome biogenesis GTP-binding protein YihA/YsxC [Culicoidibacter larvae]TLG76640.1 YihA family ribosome biogenesis GTP-binding protein [Culicoidibacter larvae]
MKITSSAYALSAVRADQYPPGQQAEIMLAGRSNVGKSSCINALLNNSSLARISSRPGKTQTLNFYHINERFYFVDVPGYGYAKVSKKQREAFGKMIEEYITSREELRVACLLVDFRHKPTEDDVLMYNFFKYYDVPVIVIATKVDKIGKTHRAKHEKMIRETLKLHGDDKLIPFSSVDKTGKIAVWSAIESFL